MEDSSVFRAVAFEPPSRIAFRIVCSEVMSVLLVQSFAAALSQNAFRFL